MAALTRQRADYVTQIPNDLHVEYYSARASAGFILTECSSVSPEGNAYPGAASIFNDEQTAGWKRVVDAVHAKGGRIFLQIWHGGRAVHPSKVGGLQTYGPSAIAIPGAVHTKNGRVPHEVPKACTKEDIQRIVADFRRGAENAKKSGFDGIEIHGSNGYIVDQFLKESSNQRDDEYGGSFENRARFLFEVLDQILEVFPPERTGIKLSPLNESNGQYDSQGIALNEYVIEGLNKRNIAFIEIDEALSHDQSDSEKRAKYYAGKEKKSIRAHLRPLFKGTYIANFRFNKDTANAAIEAGECDLVSFGHLYCQNDNLVEKFENNIAPTYNMSPFIWQLYF